MLNILNPMRTLSSLRYYVISFITLCKPDLYSVLFACLPSQRMAELLFILAGIDRLTLLS